MDRQDRIDLLHDAVRHRVLLLDGPRGTMLQKLNLTERDFRGDRFAAHERDLKGNNEAVTLVRPDLLHDIHLAFYRAGSDVVGTNTFCANAISQSDYGTEACVAEMNEVSARIAREAADQAMREDGRTRWVAGAIGPTTCAASLSPTVDDPGARAVTFDELCVVFRQQIEALVEGGVDLLLFETFFDTLNAKAALFAAEELFDEQNIRLPVIISGTISDLSGRLLSGQTVEAFWNSVRHVRPFAVGLNCALGAKELRPHVSELSRIADIPVSAYPNAGLPNAFGDYDQTPAESAELVGEFVRSGLVNIVGGCCGTTPDHIRAIAEAIDGVAPRRLPRRGVELRLSGLEPCNVAA